MSSPSAGETLNGQLDQYASWLRLQARLQVGPAAGGKFDASDIAQQTMMEAWKNAAQFQGQQEGQRLAWLRQILAHVIAHEFRKYYGTQKRNVRQEVSIDESLAASSRQLTALLPSTEPSPSQVAVQREQELIVAEVLEHLPEDYREVIILRNLEGLTHAEVAQRMDRSEAAVKMLWVRALKRLQEEVQRIS